MAYENIIITDAQSIFDATKIPTSSSPYQNTGLPDFIANYGIDFWNSYLGQDTQVFTWGDIRFTWKSWLSSSTAYWNYSAVQISTGITLYSSGNSQINKGNTSKAFRFYIGFAVDEENQKGYILAGFYWQNNNLSQLNRYAANADAAYTAIKASEIPEYNWTTVGTISGKLGTFTLSRVNDANLNNGEPVTGALDTVIRSISEQTKIDALAANVPLYTAIEAIYAGQVDYMGIMPSMLVNDIIYNISFVLAGNTIYSTSTFENTYLQILIDEENEVAKLSLLHKTGSNPNTWSYNTETMTATEMHNLYLWVHSHIEPDDEDEQDNNEGDDGTGVRPWLDIAVGGLSKPSISAIDTGFTSMYMVTVGELKNLARFLWSDDFINNVKKFFNDPREILVGLSIMPINPDTEATQTEIKAGGISTGVSGYKLTDQYKLLSDAATCEIKTENGNFLDFPPYTKVTAHIPFCGAHSLDVNDIMGKTLTLSYIFDFLTGTCVAMIKTNGKPRYFFSGTTGIQIPTSAEDFGRMYSSILSAGATIGGTLSTIATGGLTAPLAIGAASSMAANGMNMTPNVSYTSGGGSVAGMLTSQDAFITVEIPNAKKAKNQYAFTGRPSFVKRQLSSCKGYTKVLEVHLTDLICTETERQEIESVLKSGVIIEDGSQAENEPSVTPSVTGNLVIVFLKMTSEQNVIGKSWNTSTGEEMKLEGKLLYNQSIINPTILINGNVTGYNYCYIPLFDRFYYITNQIAENGTMMQILLRVDPLQSFKTAILNCYAIIERQQKSGNYNVYFGDNQMWTQQNKTILTNPFMVGKNAFSFARENNAFILTIAGGD